MRWLPKTQASGTDLMLVSSFGPTLGFYFPLWLRWAGFLIGLAMLLVPVVIFGIEKLRAAGRKRMGPILLSLLGWLIVLSGFIWYAWQDPRVQILILSDACQGDPQQLSATDLKECVKKLAFEVRTWEADYDGKENAFVMRDLSSTDAMHWSDRMEEYRHKKLAYFGNTYHMRWTALRKELAHRANVFPPYPPEWLEPVLDRGGFNLYPTSPFSRSVNWLEEKASELHE